MERQNAALTAHHEKEFLDKIALRIPKLIGADLLTLLALFAAIGIGLCYIFGPTYRVLYLLAALFYALHWFGDSLDGRIAVLRKKPRPNYGHYVDHMLDSISLSIIMGSLTASAITYTSSWLWAISGFLLLMIHAYLKASVTGKFELSVGRLGPTEARIIGGIFSVLLFFIGNPLVVVIASKPFPFSFMDIIGMIASAIMWTVLIVNAVKTAVILNKSDKKKWKSS